MKYEQELIELIPMLKSWLRITMRKYASDFHEDAFQTCLMNAVRAVENKDVRNPRAYLFGVFKHTIGKIRVQESREKQARNSMPKRVRYHRLRALYMIMELDRLVMAESERTQMVWHCLKEWPKDRRKIARLLRCHPVTVTNHKRRLLRLFEKAKQAIPQNV